MNSNPHNPLASESFPGAISNSGSGPAEETLRLIASLPAPAGLEDRVHAALHADPRHGRVLAWPKALHPQSAWIRDWIRDWTRSAAAAAIVFVVVGGGWGVYSHVLQGQPAKVIIMPRVVQPGGFSGAGAIRTPQTLPGPTVTEPAKARPAQPKGTKKNAARPALTGARSGQTAPAARPAVQPGASK